MTDPALPPQPPTPPQPPQPPTPPPDPGPSVRDVLEERFLPEARGASPRTRRRAVVIIVVLGVLSILGGFAVGYSLDLWTTGPRVAAEREATEELDEARAPFTGSISYDTSVPDRFKIVLDRPLTPEEQETLLRLSDTEIWDFLRPLGGRLIRYPVTMAQLPPGYDLAQQGDTTVFTMNLLSSRETQLSIVDMEPVNVSCTEPAAATVVEVPGQGESFYPGVLTDLSEDAPTLWISDEGPDQGQPYFSRRRIDLGGGLDPGGLRVEALVRDQSCEWELRARYRDARGEVGEVVLRDGDRPFFAEAVPADPEQYWLSSGMFPGLPLTEDMPTFQPCHELPDDPSCATQAEGRR
ncbi:hypothetical protein [Streptomyces hainanensis]|uniref:Uncharacterized protein n=1 Tax=Streptomyces hainanensis TaxID=402648 RepID=A0A4R4TBR6_9ACTN|nr:hypothetical protein [Streptomyces hainanensis]TDC74918.1 hypothetical protein E1283_14090 [Streptomyces hainanensis]